MTARHLAEELDRVMQLRLEAARRDAALDHARAVHARDVAVRRRRRVMLEHSPEGTLVTITAPTEGILLLRIFGSFVLLMLAILCSFVGWTPTSLLVTAGFGAIAAVAWRSWPYRIWIAAGAFALVGKRRDRYRYVAPITELAMRMRYGVLVVGTDRRMEFYGVRHPEDLAVVEQLQARLDAVRR